MKSPESSKRRRVVNGRVEKLCKHCEHWKPLAELTPMRTCHDGFTSTCRACTRVLWKMADMRRAS